jgi:hypothetical protein
MTGYHEITNPYAAPEPVEEDAPDYGLRKIARLYNRLGWVLKWFVPLFVVCTLGFAGVRFSPEYNQQGRAVTP